MSSPSPILGLPESFKLKLPHHRSVILQPGKPIIMGILNVTPDSFSDGGKFTRVDDALDHAKQMIDDGAEIIDVGGESSRPGAAIVSCDEELERVIPVIERLASLTENPIISIDTTKSMVAQMAIEAGAHFVNDISAGEIDKNILEVVAQKGAGYCVMHMQGDPQTMQRNPNYKNVVEDVFNYLADRVKFAIRLGIKKECICIDPGIGFGKTNDHNILLIKSLSEFQRVGFPILIGISRKRFLDNISDNGLDVEDRDRLSQLVHLDCIRAGASILRVHHPKMALETIRYSNALKKV